MNVSQGLARFVLDFKRSQTDDALKRAAVAAIVDGTASLVGGVREDFGRILHAYARATMPGPDAASTIVASDMRAAPAFAAYINAAAGHSLCYDDTSNAMMGHPTVVVLPAALAVAESLGSSGDELIDAFALGVEVAVRDSELLAPGHYQRGWHATGMAGVIGAAAAAIRLLRLGEAEAVHALGIAATRAAGLRANFGTMAMIYHAGLAARGGVDAALLAQLGMTSAGDPFSGSKGYFSLFAWPPDKPVDTGRLLQRLGKPFELVSPGLDVKPFPCGSLSHRAIQGALELRAENGVDSRDVVDVDCALPELHQDVLVHTHPDSMLAARISLVYPVAVALRNGSCTVNDFTPDLIKDPEIQRLMGIVKISPIKMEARRGEDLFAAPAEVTLKLRDGRTLHKRVEVVKASPGYHLTAQEVREKFDSCAEPSLGKAASEQLWDAVWRLDRIRDVRELTALMVAKTIGAAR
ncbi:MAG: MmgE/PrpD family protein [Vulcanimicrobiaceae bacterium]